VENTKRGVQAQDGEIKNKDKNRCISDSIVKGKSIRNSKKKKKMSRKTKTNQMTAQGLLTRAVSKVPDLTNSYT